MGASGIATKIDPAPFLARIVFIILLELIGGCAFNLSHIYKSSFGKGAGLTLSAVVIQQGTASRVCLVHSSSRRRSRGSTRSNPDFAGVSDLRRTHAVYGRPVHGIRSRHGIYVQSQAKQVPCLGDCLPPHSSVHHGITRPQTELRKLPHTHEAGAGGLPLSTMQVMGDPVRSPNNLKSRCDGDAYHRSAGTFAHCHRNLNALAQKIIHAFRTPSNFKSSAFDTSFVSCSPRIFTSTLSPVFGLTTTRSGMPMRSASFNFSPVEASRSS